MPSARVLATLFLHELLARAAPIPLRSRVSLLAPLLFAIGTALLIASCSGTARTAAPGLPNNFPDHSPDQIRTQVLGNSDSVDAYRARARITVRTPGQDRTVNAVVHHRRADSLFMRFSLFGVEGGRLLLTRDSVFFYDTRRAVLRVGPAQDVQSIFPAPVSSPDFFRNMLGLIAPAPGPNGSVAADSTLYYVSDPTSRTRYTVDPTRWRVVRYERRSTDGRVVQKRLFSNFRRVQGLLLPSRVIFERPSANLRAMVRYQDMTLNPTDLSFALDVPSQVPRRPFAQGR